MIIINSSDTDQTTNDVIDWLRYYRVNYKRINDSDEVRIRNLTIDNGIDFEIEFLTTGEILKAKEISFFWYRRGELNLDIDCDIEEQAFLQKEQFRLKQLVNHYLRNKVPSLGSFNDNYINKLIVLNEAESVGLAIPKTLITSNKKDLVEFKEQHKNIITKAIDNARIAEFTKIVGDEAIKSSDRAFFYTLFQSYKEKLVELRIFFLKNRFWATAIFSQNDEQTKVDFRNYNYIKPNRLAPFILPKEITRKLNELNRKLKLTSGSIDMILTPDNEYVLLEINPVGQFRTFSYFGNLNLEKHIAEYIIKNERKTTAV